jgi:hypothetical protein
MRLKVTHPYTYTGPQAGIQAQGQAGAEVGAGGQVASCVGIERQIAVAGAGGTYR